MTTLTSGWLSPSSIFGEAKSPESIHSDASTPRSGMTRSRREELEIWRKQKRQKRAESTIAGNNTPHPSKGPVRLASSCLNNNKNEIRTPLGTLNGSRKSVSTNGSSDWRTPNAGSCKPIKMSTFASDSISSQKAVYSSNIVSVPAEPSSVNSLNTESASIHSEKGIEENGKVIAIAEILPSEMHHSVVPMDLTVGMSVEEATANTIDDKMSSEVYASANVLMMEVLKPIDEASRGSIAHSQLHQVPPSPLLTEISVEIEKSDDAQLKSTDDKEPVTNNNVISESEAIPESKTKEEYDISLLLLANDTLVQHLSESEARRVSECGRLRQEREELRLELRMQESRFKLHAQRLEDTMQQSLMASIERIQELTQELEQARATICKLQRRCKQRKDDK
jgi:hypothetical protein